MNTTIGLLLRPNWQARAVVSGFVASVVMLFAFLAAYGLAGLLARLDLGTWPVGATLTFWLRNLTNNSVISLAAQNLYVAAALFLVGGLCWAYGYAAIVEPRLTGPVWRQGALFALAPAVLTQLIVLPIVGGGVAGSALDAGPLPALGIMLLHLVYGATLGLVYGPAGDSDDEVQWGRQPLNNVLMRSERLMAIGVVGGAVLGGLLGGLLIGLRPFVVEIHPAGLLLGGALLFSALGLLVGSFAGLSPTADEQAPQCPWACPLPTDLGRQHRLGTSR